MWRRAPAARSGARPSFPRSSPTASPCGPTCFASPATPESRRKRALRRGTPHALLSCLMPFWTLRRAFGAAAVLALSLDVGWAAVVLAVAVTAARDQATTADAIVVLGAAQYNGRPSPVFRSRL